MVDDVYDFFLLYYRSLLCLECLFSRNLAVPSVNYPSLYLTGAVSSAAEAGVTSRKSLQDATMESRHLPIACDHSNGEPISVSN